MIKYNISYNRLALSMVPIGLRKSVFMNFLYVLMGQISKVASLFSQYREETDYKLAHNGQVCYLRALLNDKYDAVSRRILIEDVEERRGNVIYLRALEQYMLVPNPSTSNAVVLNKRGFSGSTAVDFNIVLPYDLNGSINEEQLMALVNNNKLASKRYTITYR